jgi:dCTP deaminase
MLKADRIADLLRDSASTEDPLVITPSPNLEELRESGSASVDLRLGTWFVALRNARLTHLRPEQKAAEAQLTKSQYIPFGTDYFLHPGAFVLGATLEWMRLPTNLGGYVTAKSSWGRFGLIIATATGVHPGFDGCLTLELTNVGQLPIAIRPGMTVCQLFLHAVEHSGGAQVDKSRFAGNRKPRLGAIKMDAFAQKLSGAYGGGPGSFVANP